MGNSNLNFIKQISYSELFLWDAKRYLYNPKFIMNNSVKLGNILYPYKQEIVKKILFKNKWRIISKINFGGKLFLREFNEINSYKGKLNIAPDDCIIYSKINVKHGCVYYHNKGEEPFAVSSEYPIFKFDSSVVDGLFLQRLLRTSFFKDLLNSKTTGISKSRVKIDEFLDIKIPLPKLEEQKKLVQSYYNKIKLAEQHEKQAQEIDQKIEQYVFEILKIKKVNKNNNKESINFINFTQLETWGVDKLLDNNKDILKSEYYQNQKLSSVTYINPRTDISELKDNDRVSFIPMECVSDIFGEVIELRDGLKVNSKGYTKFQENDLIWARITPCMQNGKSAVVKGLENKLGYGSTEFHVIRYKDDKVLIDYVYCLLRVKSLLQNATKYFTGSAGQQRVPKSFLENLIVPVPPIEVQKEIIEKINNLKNQKKYLLNEAEQNRKIALEEFEQKVFQ